MNDYIELRCKLDPCNEIMTDLLAALLAEYEFESFVPDSEGLTAYVKKELFNREACEAVCRDFPLETNITMSDTLIEGCDWNSEWEKHYFRPIIIGNRCVIHSSFHTDIPVCDYDIVIDPKMAFGTGHHSTTSLILNRLLDMDLEDKKIVDMGTGTGILAILAAMRGAKEVTGIEIDPFAYENALDNVKTNGHPEINMLLGDASHLVNIKDVDLLLANINRNIVITDLPEYTKSLRKGGSVILSGFYMEDTPLVQEAAEKCGLKLIDITSDNNWASMLFEKTA